jgi:hypothetical protein
MTGVDPVQNSARLKLRELAVANPVVTSSVMVKKSAVEDVGGFDEQFKGPEDYDLWLRLVAKHKCVKLDMPLVRYRNVQGSLSMDAGRFFEEVLKVIDKAYGEGGVLEGQRGRRRKARAYQMLSAAWTCGEAGEPRRAFVTYAKSFLEWPFSFRPEKNLPLGRVKLLWFLLKKLGKTGVSTANAR